MSINRAILLGHVGGDPEIRTLNNDTNVAQFNLATSERWTDKDTKERKERTNWHRIVVFNQHIIDVVRNYVKKGSKVGIEGSIETRKYTDKNNIERSVTEIVLRPYDGRLTLEDVKEKGSGSSVREDDYGTVRTRESGIRRDPDDKRTMIGSGHNSYEQELDDDIPF
ncbi:Single-stranded DNA-binding protein [Liberibacter crescens BT-1]|uniref:Single-stranded DNA-binding protein n=1 Tax=Liberibacter crescens (strain BT-1) TaxID=1215343 RepID=L0EUZ9_LIBCB|nr:single-stranded DNA-binding protein [Liberibacter crescens]AGA64483.1 Single-stranded DNA-binding protein [Liberibacter crescens BT-1]